MAKEKLDDLLAKITPENQYPLLLDSTERGRESWSLEIPSPTPPSPLSRGQAPAGMTTERLSSPRF